MSSPDWGPPRLSEELALFQNSVLKERGCRQKDTARNAIPGGLAIMGRSSETAGE